MVAVFVHVCSAIIIYSEAALVDKIKGFILFNGPKVIFAAAFQKFAPEGFKLEAIDYLLKPFGYEEFLAAAVKAHKFIELERIKVNGVETNEQFLFIKSEHKICKVNFADILFLWAKIEFGNTSCFHRKKTVLV